MSNKKGEGQRFGNIIFRRESSSPWFLYFQSLSSLNTVVLFDNMGKETRSSGATPNNIDVAAFFFAAGTSADEDVLRPTKYFSKDKDATASTTAGTSTNRNVLSVSVTGVAIVAVAVTFALSVVVAVADALAPRCLNPSNLTYPQTCAVTEGCGQAVLA